MRFLLLLAVTTMSLSSCESDTVQAPQRQSLDTAYLHTFTKVSVQLTGTFTRDVREIDTNPIFFFDNENSKGSMMSYNKPLVWNGRQFSYKDSSYQYHPPWKYGGWSSWTLAIDLQGSIDESNRVHCTSKYFYKRSEEGLNDITERRITFNSIPLLTKNDSSLDFTLSGEQLQPAITDIYEIRESRDKLNEIHWESLPKLLVHFSWKPR